MKEIYSIITIEDAGGKWFVLQKNNFLWYLLLSFEEKKRNFFQLLLKLIINICQFLLINLELHSNNVLKIIWPPQSEIEPRVSDLKYRCSMVILRNLFQWRNRKKLREKTMLESFLFPWYWLCLQSEMWHQEKTRKLLTKQESC